MPEKLAGDRPLKIPDWSVETCDSTGGFEWRARCFGPRVRSGWRALFLLDMRIKYTYCLTITFCLLGAEPTLGKMEHPEWRMAHSGSGRSRLARGSKIVASHLCRPTRNSDGRRRLITMSDIKTQSVPALERGLALLEMLTGSSNGLTVSDFVRRSGLPKSSVHCLVVTLARCGYLRRCERTHRFVLDLKLLPMASTALGQIELSEQGAPHLNVLTRATQLTAHMAIYDQDESVLIGKVDSPNSCPMPTWPGKRMHTHCTALGKVMIANLDSEELDQLIRKHGLPRHNENTIASPRKLRLELDKIRNVQWALSDEEYAMGLRCIAAPIFNHLGKAFAAVSISGTVSQITGDNCSSLAERVKATASAISISLKARWKPPSPWLGEAWANTMPATASSV